MFLRGKTITKCVKSSTNVKNDLKPSKVFGLIGSQTSEWMRVSGLFDLGFEIEGEDNLVCLPTMQDSQKSNYFLIILVNPLLYFSQIDTIISFCLHGHIYGAIALMNYLIQQYLQSCWFKNIVTL